MTRIYPNALDIYGFCPAEAEYDVGDCVTGRRTGICGRVTFRGGDAVVYAGGVFYEICEIRDEKKGEHNGIHGVHRI